MGIHAFQRARDPRQKELRRRDLLEAARALLLSRGIAEVGLSAIARRVGVAKSNVYRYFASREEILLELLAADALAWVAEVERAAAALPDRDDVVAVSALVSRSAATRPLTCQLISVVAGVLEHNTSEEAAERFKASMLELSIRLRNVLLAALPSLPHERAAEAVRYLHALIAGLWPMAHPCERMQAIVARPEHAGLVTDFERDLRNGFGAMLAGLSRCDPASERA